MQAGLVQTAFLGEKVHGENQVLLLDPLRYDRIPQAQWMDHIGRGGRGGPARRGCR